MSDVKISLFDEKYRPTGSIFCDEWFFIVNDVDKTNVELYIPQHETSVTTDSVAFVYIQEQFRAMLYKSTGTKFELCEDLAQFDEFLKQTGPNSIPCQCKKKAIEDLEQIMQTQDSTLQDLKTVQEKLNTMFAGFKREGINPLQEMADLMRKNIMVDFTKENITQEDPK